MTPLWCEDCGAELQPINTGTLRCPWATSSTARVSTLPGPTVAVHCGRPRPNPETARYELRWSDKPGRDRDR